MTSSISISSQCGISRIARKDLTGPRGFQGPEGMEGPQGEQGPIGEPGTLACYNDEINFRATDMSRIGPIGPDGSAPGIFTPDGFLNPNVGPMWIITNDPSSAVVLSFEMPNDLDVTNNIAFDVHFAINTGLITEVPAQFTLRIAGFSIGQCGLFAGEIGSEVCVIVPCEATNPPALIHFTGTVCIDPTSLIAPGDYAQLQISINGAECEILPSPEDLQLFLLAASMRYRKLQCEDEDVCEILT